MKTAIGRIARWGAIAIESPTPLDTDGPFGNRETVGSGRDGNLVGAPTDLRLRLKAHQPDEGQSRRRASDALKTSFTSSPVHDGTLNGLHSSGTR